MFSALLASYPDEDDRQKSDSQAGFTARSSVQSPVEAFTSCSVSTKKVDFLRLQMRCPTIMGVDPGTTAHGVFASNSSSSGAFPLPRNKSSGCQIASSDQRRRSGECVTSAAASAAGEGAGQRDKPTGSSSDGVSLTLAGEADPRSQASTSGVVMGPDNVPLVKYETGVFSTVEQESFESFRKLKQLQHRLAEEARERQSAAGGGSMRLLNRGQALLSMLPKPQSDVGTNQLDALVFRVRKGQKSAETGCSSFAPDTSASPRCIQERGSQGSAGCTILRDERDLDGDNLGVKSELVTEEENKSTAGCRTKRKQQDRPARDTAEEQDTEHSNTGTKDEPGASGPLFTLFAEYNDDDEDFTKEEKNFQATCSQHSDSTRGSTGTALLAGKPGCSTEGESRHLESVHACALRPDYGPELSAGPAAGTGADVWGLSEGSTAGQGDGRAEQPPMVEGMSLREYQALQNASIGSVSGDSLRDPNWQVNAHLHCTSAQAKRAKLNITTNVWSAQDKTVIQTQEPRVMQKRKHQINWLAAEAAEKEIQMWEMVSKNRQNKYQTAMKYGW